MASKPSKHELVSDLHRMWAEAKTEEEADEILNYIKMVKEGEDENISD
ncbi:MAG: hypothetical protein LLG05_18910 [Porphyromonadaceae bacterium]|nr:hypothetical protein [Porphyromonadaceae bacterium]